ncbi:MAG: serine/threonine-protein kinase [Myxococcaceae bacterium]
MKTQSCPNCQRAHDVTVYVTGQRILCSCGIRFDVRRTDVSTIRVQSQRPEPAIAAAASGGAANILEPNVLDEDAAPAEDLPGVGLTVSGRRGRSDDVVSGPPASSELGQTFISASRVEIPGFDLTELLGRGGMGEVWRAHQRSLGRTVAVKLLPPDLAKDREFVTRFEKEATALAALSHPHITQIIDRGVAGEHYFFVMEYVEGRSLREVLNTGRPSPQESLRLISQVLRAIECAHEKEIIHRDLKPENILLDARGHVKVADFGLAGMRGGEERLQLTATAVAMGTINYMAPEQRRDARNVDARADLYAVGVVLYELLTGELPIGRFRLPSERVPGLDPRLDPVVASLLESDPMERCRSAAEALAAIGALLSGSPVGPLLKPGALGSNTSSVITAGPVARSAPTVIETGRRAVKTGLLVIGALAAIGMAARIFLPGAALTLSGSNGEITLSPNGFQTTARSAPKGLPPNTYGEVFSDVTEEELGDGRTRLRLGFGVGDEEVNVHSGQWRMTEGRLEAIQAGSDTGGKRLIPRAYVAHRYFSTDDFEVSANVTMRDLKDRYEVEKDAQRFSELAIRILNLQVSAFSIPGVGMRLGWRYRRPDGTEVSGNSAQDLEMLVEDETPAPPDGQTFRLGVRLNRVKAGIEAQGLLNGRPFARKVLPGLEGQLGKVTVGCRNYECVFDDIEIEGKEAEAPER